jgi:anhydro-N-acetylmuramic acid kinase
MLSLGLMSGTSMDGIDAALIETDGKNFVKELAASSLAYHIDFRTLLKAAELAVRSTQGDLQKAETQYAPSLKSYLTHNLQLSAAAIPDKLRMLSLYLHKIETADITLARVIQHSTELHARVVNNLLTESGYTAKQIQVIGYHGQTLYHRPAVLSLQVGNAKMLANMTGIPVIADFRSNDIAAGGQGAPFAPLFHQALAIRDALIPAAVVNCGGIANITIINNDDPNELIGFDTGAGNCLLDRYISLKTGGKDRMDTDGKFSRRGRVSDAVLRALYEKAIIIDQRNFFSQQPPKSLDSGDLHLIPELDALSLHDAAATLAAFTADSIVRSTDFIKGTMPRHWILAGGGWNNPVILHELKQRLQNKFPFDISILTADEAGWDGKALEAQIFAYLAVRSLQQLPISWPGTTRVPVPTCGGEIFLPASS